jgi:hypothetical protein
MYSTYTPQYRRSQLCNYGLESLRTHGHELSFHCDGGCRSYPGAVLLSSQGTRGSHLLDGHGHGLDSRAMVPDRLSLSSIGSAGAELKSQAYYFMSAVLVLSTVQDADRVL